MERWLIFHSENVCVVCDERNPSTGKTFFGEKSWRETQAMRGAAA